jgi:hypothetical protein
MAPDSFIICGRRLVEREWRNEYGETVEKKANNYIIVVL